jgi:hypothetical protein
MAGVALLSHKPNYAIKGTSVETLDSSELSSGASVPYLGCWAPSLHSIKNLGSYEKYFKTENH